MGHLARHGQIKASLTAAGACWSVIFIARRIVDHLSLRGITARFLHNVRARPQWTQRAHHLTASHHANPILCYPMTAPVSSNGFRGRTVVVGPASFRDESGQGLRLLWVKCQEFIGQRGGPTGGGVGYHDGSGLWCRPHVGRKFGALILRTGVALHRRRAIPQLCRSRQCRGDRSNLHSAACLP